MAKKEIEQLRRELAELTFKIDDDRQQTIDAALKRFEREHKGTVEQYENEQHRLRTEVQMLSDQLSRRSDRQMYRDHLYIYGKVKEFTGTFRGDEPQIEIFLKEWLGKVQRALDNPLYEGQKGKVLSLLLEGYAKTNWEIMPDADKSDYDAIVQMLKQTFIGPLHKHTKGILFNEARMKLNESYEGYAARLRILAREHYDFEPSVIETVVIDRFMNTIPEVIKRYIYEHSQHNDTILKSLEKIIHTDQGACFMSKLITDLCELLQIRKTKNPPYTPSFNGQVERSNKVIAESLSALVKQCAEGKISEWDKYVPLICLAYNSTKHATTKHVPAMLVYGRIPRTSIDVLFGTNRPTNPETVDSYAKTLKDRLKIAFQEVNKETENATERQKIWFDKKVRGEAYNLGDNVYLRRMVYNEGESKKFADRWKGPYEVINVLGHVTYEIIDHKTNHNIVVHFKNLKPAYTRNVDTHETKTQNESKQKQTSILKPPVVPEDPLKPRRSSRIPKPKVRFDPSII